MGILSYFSRWRKRAPQLYSQARELVDAGDFDAALAVARKLRKLSYSGAFEIEGLSYAGLNRHEDAVRVLREGLQHAPTVWLNWHLLANCLSDLGRFDEALAAFDRAAACPDVDRSYVNLNRAVVAVRSGNFEGALKWLDEVHRETTLIPAIATRISALRGLRRDDEASQLAERTLRAWSDAGKSGDEVAVGAIARAAAEMRRSRGENLLAIRTFVVGFWQATRADELLWMIRDIQPQHSPSARYFRLLIHGEKLATSDAGGFFTTVDAIADSVEEAMMFAKELDDFDGAANVSVNEVTDLGSRPDEPKGVYAARGRAYYREESR